MEKRSFEVDYDKEHDIVSIFRAGAKSKVSLDIALPNGDVIIDYSSEGQIIGLEIFNASHYLPALKDLNPSSLKGKFSVQYGPNWAEIAFEIASPSISQPIVNRIFSPYNKEHILEA